MTGATLRQALASAARGWPALPCLPGERIPATAHGYRDATTDERQITVWFASHPDWNLAIATVHRPRRPGRRRPRSGRERIPGVPSTQRRRAADGAAVPTPAPPAAACTPTSPARTSATATCPPTTWTAAGRRVRPDPALPDRRPPYQLISQPGGRGGLDWAAVTRPPATRTPPPAPPPAPDRQPRPDRPGPLGRQPARRQPQRRPVLGRQPRPGRRPRRRPEPARRRRPPGRPRRRGDHPDPELRPQHHPPPARPPSRGQLT